MTIRQNLKSAEEMEVEERDAQSAKLQELIRRGGPEDLREANRLMKIMAGYDTRNKTDYRAKAAEEVSRVQQKAKLLEERLQSFKPGDTMSDGDVFSVGTMSCYDDTTNRDRNWLRRYKARTLKSRRCVKRSPTIMKLLPNYSKLMTAYTELSSAIG